MLLPAAESVNYAFYSINGDPFLYFSEIKH